MIPKAAVNTVGEHIQTACRKPPKPHKPLLPDEAVDGCESTHVAGSGSNSKTNMEKFDNSGLMALVCRHDIPLFIANIDTPGEQQMYAVALLLHLFSLLPPNTMVAALYNVGKGVEMQKASARQVLADSNVPIDVLRAQWADQRQAQLSICAHAPTQLKKELNSVLNLQGQMDALDQAIQGLRKELSKGEALKNSIDLLSKLQQMQEEFKAQGEDLYSLAIGSFLEWDKLDQASSGREQSLGTKLHQATRTAIAKHAPVLMNAIQKFNSYCDKLAAMYREEWSIPLPQPLLIKLADLRESPLLMEDIWISQTSGERPRWLVEHKVWEGIQAMLKINCCVEEQRRLGMEADNLCQWFGCELQALHAARASSNNSSISMLLQQQYDALLLLKGQWSSPLASVERFNAHINSLRNRPLSPHVTWMPVMIQLDDHSLNIIQEDDKSVMQGLTSVKGLPPPLPSLVPSMYHNDNGEDNTMLLDFILDGGQISNDGRSEEEAGPVLAATVSKMTLVASTSRTKATSKIRPVFNPATTPAPPLVPLLMLKTFSASPWTTQISTTTPAPLLTTPIPATTPELVTTTKPIVELLWALPGSLRILFEIKAIDIMSNPAQLLNDTCINGLAQLIHGLFLDSRHPASLTSSQCALFSMHNLSMIQFNVADSQFWRQTYKTKYWNKSCWIIPIHQPQDLHWVLCCVYPETRKFFLFDSLAVRDPWVQDIKNLHQFVERLVINANRNGKALHVVTDEG
ncbi:hypothetical protein C0991_011827 [Blastosporella zonata]|nr:hypothetical protein C0991_011827 [Blastosporella zonata]